METNAPARAALPINLRPPSYKENVLVAQNSQRNDPVGSICQKLQITYQNFNRNLEQYGGGKIWNIYSSKMVNL